MSYLKRSFAGRIAITFRLQRLLAQQACKELGITETQIAFLAYILASPGISQDEISHRYFIDKGATARQTTKLEQLGLIKKMVDPDNQRKKKLSPTKAGREIEPIFYEKVAELNASFLAPLNKKEQETLLSLLDRVTANMIQLNTDKIDDK